MAKKYDPFSMHSITIGDKNTWEDWHLIAKERPAFARPSKISYYVDVPGMSGSLDYSDSLTGYPTYKDREGSFTFYVSNDYWQSGYSYTELINEIADYLDQTTMRAILEDDDQWFYEGKFELSDYKPTHTWGEVTIKYRVNPFKWSIHASDEPWEWDPFRFPDGVITSKIFSNIHLNSTEEWKEIPVTKKEVMSQAPICPDITVETTGTDTIEVHFINPDLNIDATEVMKSGAKQLMSAMIITGNNCKLYVRGNGIISFIFRKGEL